MGAKLFIANFILANLNTQVTRAFPDFVKLMSPSEPTSDRSLTKVLKTIERNYFEIWTTRLLGRFNFFYTLSLNIGKRLICIGLTKLDFLVNRLHTVSSLGL